MVMLAKVANDKCKIAFLVAGSIISLGAWDMKGKGLE
jgi:hypothetical protein